MDVNDQDHGLLQKLELLMKRQNEFAREIDALKMEIRLMRSRQADVSTVEEETPVKPAEVSPSEGVNPEVSKPQYSQPFERLSEQTAPASEPPKVAKFKSDFEKFIGENLINKIGMVITIIGVFIGVKYSIDHELINPLTRVILGYLSGLTLLGFGIRLKLRYENFSAVLVSGAMAILYFITFAAFAFYALFPQTVAFLLMVLFTVFTVAAALHYNRQVIAHIGLVGAYAVPFLLSDGSGNVLVLFSYTALINVGILAIALKKYWIPVFYSAFVFTWLIYGLWYLFQFHADQHFGVAFPFLMIFFLLFYTTFLANQISRKGKLGKGDLILILSNSFVFYGLGYSLMATNKAGGQLLGLFTLGNGLIHFLASLVVYRQKLIDRNLVYLVSGLVLVFITIAIPVQLDGNWVTLLWVSEATLLFWIGRSKSVAFIEKLAYPLMVLAFFSLVHDWGTEYGHYQVDSPESRLRPFLNVHFLSSLLFAGAFGLITHLQESRKYATSLALPPFVGQLAAYLVPGILLVSLYFAFRVEIGNYWQQLYLDSGVVTPSEPEGYPTNYYDMDLLRFKSVWLINFSMLYLVALMVVNHIKIRNQSLGMVGAGLSAFAVVVFLTQGLDALGDLRNSFLNPPLSQYYQPGLFNVWIRYVSLCLVVLELVLLHRWFPVLWTGYRKLFDLFLHVTLLWLASSELIHWMDLAGSASSYKLGLSILWGVYSLMLISFGIWQKKKHLRLGAIALFGLTLVKLFFYDISHLDTIAKTIVFVSLGVLLLLISFLYNKFKHLITTESDRG